jgi:hypothetical protein
MSRIVSTKQLLLALLAVAGAAQRFAAADLISLNTASASEWNVQRVLVGGESDPTPYNGPAIETTNTPGNGGTPGDGTWIVFNDPARTPYDPTAKWVSWIAKGGNSRFIPDGYFSDANGTTYIYTKTFTLGAFGGNAHLDLGGYMAFDNYFTAVSLTAAGSPVPVTLSRPIGPDPAGYYDPISLHAGYDFVGPQQFTLTITGVNTGSAGAGPTGLIFSGAASATAVPEPASALFLLASGSSLLIRRRRFCSAHEAGIPAAWLR